MDFKVEQLDGADFVIPAEVVADEILVANLAAYNTYEAEQMEIVNGANTLFQIYLY